MPNFLVPPTWVDANSKTVNAYPDETFNTKDNVLSESLSPDTEPSGFVSLRASGTMNMGTVIDANEYSNGIYQGDRGKSLTFYNTNGFGLTARSSSVGGKEIDYKSGYFKLWNVPDGTKDTGGNINYSCALVPSKKSLQQLGLIDHKFQTVWTEVVGGGKNLTVNSDVSVSISKPGLYALCIGSRSRVFCATSFLNIFDLERTHISSTYMYDTSDKVTISVGYASNIITVLNIGSSTDWYIIPGSVKLLFDYSESDSGALG